MTQQIGPQRDGAYAQFLVASSASEGSFTTIQSAINAAVTAGVGVVYVKPGNYTENLTFPGEVKVIGQGAYPGSGSATGLVYIYGTHTPPDSATTVTFDTVVLISAGDVFYSTDAGSASLYCNNCGLDLNGYVYNLVNWVGVLVISNCSDYSSVNSIVDNSGGTAQVRITNSNVGLSGSPAMTTSGYTLIEYSIINIPWVAANGTDIAVDYSDFLAQVTIQDNATGEFTYCRFTNLNAPSISMTSDEPVTLTCCTIDTNNSPAIDGASTGTLSLTDVAFIQNNAINTSVAVTGQTLALGSAGQFVGSTSGVISVNTQAAAGTYNFNLPITAGTSGQALVSQGGGSTAMIWQTSAQLSNFVVAQDGTGNYTTIAAALSAASAGDTIFIKNGTYTENPALVAGINLCAFTCDGYTPNVIISGECTFSSAGTVAISGVELSTNSNYLLAVTGSTASIVNLVNCNINCLNHIGINHTSSSASSAVNLYNCTGNLGTTGISLFSKSSAGSLLLFGCNMTNTGASTTSTSCSAGTNTIIFSNLAFPVFGSLTSTVVLEFSIITTTVNAYGTSGTGTGHAVISCILNTGTVPGIAIGTGTTVTVTNTSFKTTNTNIITGAGTLKYLDLSCTSTGSGITATTATQLSKGLPVDVANGGTGLATLTAHNVMLGEGTSSVAFASPTSSTSGNPLISQGAGADPVFSTTASVTQITVSNTPVNPSDGVNKAYVDLIAAGFSFKTACKASTTANLTATYNNGSSGVGATLTNSGTQLAFATDGYSASLNDRILVQFQTTQADNGIYSVTTVGSGSTNWVLTRTTDYDTAAEMAAGTITGVINGTLYANTFWVQVDVITTVGTDSVQFNDFGFNPTQFLQVSNNLSDVASKATSRSNLGLTAVATQSVTQYDTLVGGASNAITSISAGTAGAVYLSGGAAANPSFVVPTTVTGLTLTTNASTLEYDLTVPVLVSSGGTGVTSLTANAPVLSGATSTTALTTLPLTNGQLIIGSTGAIPVASTLTAGTGISITNGAGSITLANVAQPGIVWSVIIAGSGTLTANNGYIANNAGTISFSLPATATIGDTYRVTGINNATGWKITQNAGQTIHFGTATTTTGVLGSLESSATRDSVEIVCVATNNTFNVISSIGNITVV